MPVLAPVNKYQDGESVNQEVLNRPIDSLEQNQIDINSAFEDHIDQVTTPDPHPQYEKKKLNNITTTDPTSSDDSVIGYEPFSRWINSDTSEVWVCIDAAEGAAVWQKASLTIDELGSAALLDTSDIDDTAIVYSIALG